MNHRTRLPDLVNRLLVRNLGALSHWLYREPDEFARTHGWTAEHVPTGRRYHDPGLPARLRQHAAVTVPVRAGPPPPESAADAKAWARWSR